MNTREKYSAGLLCLGLILALLPLSSNISFTAKPDKLLASINDRETYLSVDQVARLVASEDKSIQIIDLRKPEEFRSVNIPGSINIPYGDFIKSDPASILSNRNIKYIFYSNGDFESNYALVFARGVNIVNTFVMKGGLNEWFGTVMNSSFTGEKISARENALYENRIRARRLFNEMNSMPDSLKRKFLEARHLAAKKLDGGCE